MVNICDYSGIAKDYDKWSTGDRAYNASAAFYLDYFAGRSGVFAELGVGTGRIAIPLSRREGVKVYGIDINEQMLKQCAQNSSPDANLVLIKDDFMSFTLPEPVSTVYMPFRTIGHILTNEALFKFFINIKKNLEKGGLFIFDHYIFDKNWAMKNNGVDILMFDDGVTRIIDRYIFNFISGTMNCLVTRNGEEAVSFTFRWIEVEEIRSLIAYCGFSLQALFGDFDKSEWSQNSPNQIWVLKY